MDTTTLSALSSFINIFLDHGGGATIALTAVLAMWFVTLRESARKDKIIESKDAQLLELTREAVTVAASANSTASSLLDVLSSRSARR